MAKDKKMFVCQTKGCGYQTANNMAFCPECEEFGTLKLTVISASSDKKPKNPLNGRFAKRTGIYHMSDIEITTQDRYWFGGNEPSQFDKMLGGGMIPSMVVLLGGEPGNGKSTLMLKEGMKASRDMTVLYISGEESEQQVKMRANRMDTEYGELYFVYTVNFERIMNEIIPDKRPDIVIIDSIDKIFSNESSGVVGGTSQKQHVVNGITQYAKTTDTTFFLISQVTKAGLIKGSQSVEHEVDTVLYIDSDPYSNYRILRSTKNRFGNPLEIGVFEMRKDGLHGVDNPSAEFLAERMTNKAGSSVLSTVDGMTPLMLEIQAIVNPLQNNATGSLDSIGVDRRRLKNIRAVLERHLPYISGLTTSDITVNVVGGIDVNEPGADLSVAVAIVSSVLGIPTLSDWAFVGEIGLTGEVRTAQNIEMRLKEVANMQFKKVVVPRLRARIDIPKGIDIIQCRELDEAIRRTFEYNSAFKNLVKDM